MTYPPLSKDHQRLLNALPVYLAVQMILLLMTYFDTPVYIEAYRALGYTTVTGWFVIWLMLTTVGLAGVITLLANKTLETALSSRARGRYAAGYLLAVLIGLLSLGLRLTPLTPPLYFALVGLLLVILAAAHLFWSRRPTQPEEIFP